MTRKPDGYAVNIRHDECWKVYESEEKVLEHYGDEFEVKPVCLVDPEHAHLACKEVGEWIEKTRSFLESLRNEWGNIGEESVELSTELLNILNKEKTK